MPAFIDTLFAQMNAMLGLEVVAVVLAIGYVILAARKSIWCWPCAFVSTVLYTVIFWDVNLPFQVALNAYYVVMAVYGFWQWRTPANDGFVAGTLSAKQHSLIMTGILITTVLLSQVVMAYSNTLHIYTDAFVTVASVVTTIMVAHRKIENWFYWMLINTVASWLYWQVGLYLTSLLFMFYVVLSVYGWAQWRKQEPELAP